MPDQDPMMGTADDLDEIVAQADAPELCAADVRLLLEITSHVSAHGPLLDALAALRGKLRRKAPRKAHDFDPATALCRRCARFAPEVGSQGCSGYDDPDGPAPSLAVA